MILYPLIISIKIDELSNSTLGVKIISRVKSREHTRDLKGLVKFIYSVKATKFFEIFTLLLTVCTVVKSKVKISQNFVAFSEYMNFIKKYKTNVLIIDIDLKEVLIKNTRQMSLSDLKVDKKYNSS